MHTHLFPGDQQRTAALRVGSPSIKRGGFPVPLMKEVGTQEAQCKRWCGGFGQSTQSVKRVDFRDGRTHTHTNFFNINFEAPTPNPQKKSLCASFSGKERKKGAYINFSGGNFEVKNGLPNGPFSATKSLVR